KDHVTWGEVDSEVLAKLLLKRGRQVGDKPIDDAFVKGHSKFKSIWDLSQAITKGEATLADVRELRPVLRLPPPRKGYRGIKRSRIRRVQSTSKTSPDGSANSRPRATRRRTILESMST